ncbi:exo-beta-N-acetylmuramidase NamZ family protein [Microlunatus soli]|uniref:Uncharacterized conserved protein YbbC, DUF1343 family n=1 Tax=Microlunatus soli TaxID=630515 RepID=A0A1H1XIZ1_9ACTN|nr:DUF1343 domain-containing protein [Microlunatus soli]SDT09177.1 Uncharacterized conserved protein YbbC, DUF1343 family [Microlunatus soli]
MIEPTMINNSVEADARVRTGADRVASDPALLGDPGRRYGLLTNYTGVLSDLTPTGVGLLRAGVRLTALFGPEHGLRGSAQAGFSEDQDLDPDTGLPVFDSYLRTGPQLTELLDASEVEAVIIDLQDIGARFYTYLWSLYDLMIAAATTERPVIILDRPNPIGGVRAGGASLDRGYASFVGRVPIPIRHGLTLAELARHLNDQEIAAVAGRPARLSTVPMTGWRRSDHFDRTGLVWVPPSPNIPTLQTAISYVGSCLFEGTNLSEGRGTTTPFETFGAPWIDGRLTAALRERRLPGVLWRDVSFVPTFSKYAGTGCRGVGLHVIDRDSYRPIETTLIMMEILGSLYPEFGLREPGAGVDNPGESHALDRLWGSAELRQRIADRRPLLGLLDGQPASPLDWADRGVLLYDEDPGPVEGS